MQQQFLSYRQYLWAKISLVIAVLLVGSYIVYSQQTTPNGRTVAGFLYGVFGLLAMLLLMYYGVRKRTYRKNQWSLQGWLSFHCYVVVLTLLIVPIPGKGTGYPAPSPQTRTSAINASGSSVATSVR
jgi:hypothetical protein